MGPNTVGSGDKHRQRQWGCWCRADNQPVWLICTKDLGQGHCQPLVPRGYPRKGSSPAEGLDLTQTLPGNTCLSPSWPSHSGSSTPAQQTRCAVGEAPPGQPLALTARQGTRPGTRRRATALAQPLPLPQPVPQQRSQQLGDVVRGLDHDHRLGKKLGNIQLHRRGKQQPSARHETGSGTRRRDSPTSRMAFWFSARMSRADAPSTRARFICGHRGHRLRGQDRQEDGQLGRALVQLPSHCSEQAAPGASLPWLKYQKGPERGWHCPGALSGTPLPPSTGQDPPHLARRHPRRCPGLVTSKRHGNPRARRRGPRTGWRVTLLTTAAVKDSSLAPRGTSAGSSPTGTTPIQLSAASSSGSASPTWRARQRQWG